MSAGWIKLHRKMTKSAWYSKPEYVATWVHLLMRANHKDGEWMCGNQIVKIKRGQFASGRKQLSAEIGITENKLRAIIHHFKTNQQLHQQAFSKYSVFTVLNYDDYQDSNQKNNQQTTSKPPANHQQPTTNKNDKNDKEVKERRKNAPVVDYESIVGLNLTAWEEWQKYRSDRKIAKYKSPKQAENLATFPHDVQQASVDESIRQNWMGLFPEKLVEKNNGTRYSKNNGKFDALSAILNS